MVARFLQLKLQLIKNQFRRNPWEIVGVVVGFSYGIGAALAAAIGFGALRLVRPELATTIATVAGSLIVLGFLVVPLVFGADGTINPRAFALLGVPNRELALGLAIATLIGVPALAITIVSFSQVITWSRGVWPVLVSLVSFVIIVATCLLGARVTTSIATLFLATRRAREVTGLVGLLVLAAIAPIIALAVTVDWAEDGLQVLNSMAGVLEFTPLGAAWAAPGQAALGNGGLAVIMLLIAVVFFGLVALTWWFVIKRMLVTPERQSTERAHNGLGWFGAVPGNQAGVIAARSLSYWARDVRYRSSLVIVPIIPALMMATLYPAGVPLKWLALIPVPIMCFFLAWSTVHNDVAFDNTAIWLHVSANTVGWADRVGRIVPPLLLGVIVIGVGTPITAWAFGSTTIIPGLLGASFCVLLVGLGLSSIISAAFPYPAVHPGASPFSQPQSHAGVSMWVQGLSFFTVLAITVPAVWLAALAIRDGGGWSVAALIVGLLVGISVLSAGVFFGGKIFERRGPELLAFAGKF